jgi:hypothetical protein
VAKTMKYVVLIVLAIALTSFVYAASVPRDMAFEQAIGNFSYINDRLLESSRYTQPETIDSTRLDTYENEYTLDYSDDELATMGFEEMFQSDHLRVYFEKDSFSLMIRNKDTNYLWSSRAEFQGNTGIIRDNAFNRNLMNSGLWIEYGLTQKIASSTIETVSLYSMAEVEYEYFGDISENQDDPTVPYLVKSYDYDRVEVDIKDRMSQAFTAEVSVYELDLSFEVEVALVGHEIEIYVPTERIVENSERYALLAIHVFPYLGSALEDRIPGYVVIPDGVGALVRMNAYHDTYFQARFYGSDLGYNRHTLPHLSVPIFGMIHRSGENGFYAHVKEGAEVSQLIANFWGSNTRYNRITSRFSVRQIYRNVINRAGDGYETVSKTITTSNYRIAYRFLSDDEADYVGIAKDYRDHLIENGILDQKEKAKDERIPIQLSYIMSDREPSFFGTSLVHMTSPDDVIKSYESFSKEGLTNQQIVLHGWSKDGFVYREPYRFKWVDGKNMDELIETITADANDIYLHNEYVVSSELSRRISYNRDVARNLSRLKMTRSIRLINGGQLDTYYIAPEESLRLAQSDEKDVREAQLSGIMMMRLGHTLFSHYDGGIEERNQAIEIYRELVATFDSVLLDVPNDYLFDQIDGYSSMPITNSQYDYYTDLVPILPIILKGSLSYYTPHLNFNALGDERLLMMVDFAVNPSYILTEEPTYAMRFTHASAYYTTMRAEYEEEILAHYDYVNNALKHVIGAYVTGREVIETGLVAITYSNDVTILVNYSYEAKTIPRFDEIEVDARDYRVVLP